MDRVFTSEEAAKLQRILEEGADIKRDVESLNESLKDTVKAIADELDIPAKEINKAIMCVHKGNFDDHKDSFGMLESIMASAKKI